MNVAGGMVSGSTGYFDDMYRTGGVSTVKSTNPGPGAGRAVDRMVKEAGGSGVAGAITGYVGIPLPVLLGLAVLAFVVIHFY